MLYSVKTAANYLNNEFGEHRLRELMQTGKIKSFYDGIKLLTTKSELDKFIANLSNVNSTQNIQPPMRKRGSYQTKEVVNN